MGEAPYVSKTKTILRARFNNYKRAHRSYRKKRKVSKQRFHEYYGQRSHNEIVDWLLTLIEQYQKFWQHRLKIFYFYEPNENKKYFYLVIFSDIS